MCLCLVCECNNNNALVVVARYKLVPGACPKSFGMNVARLADLPADLIRLAASKSRAFEAQLKNKNKEAAPPLARGEKEDDEEEEEEEDDDDDVDVAVAKQLLAVRTVGDAGEDELVRLWEALQVA